MNFNTTPSGRLRIESSKKILFGGVDVKYINYIPATFKSLNLFYDS